MAYFLSNICLLDFSMTSFFRDLISHGFVSLFINGVWSFPAFGCARKIPTEAQYSRQNSNLILIYVGISWFCTTNCGMIPIHYLFWPWWTVTNTWSHHPHNCPLVTRSARDYLKGVTNQSLMPELDSHPCPTRLHSVLLTTLIENSQSNTTAPISSLTATPWMVPLLGEGMDGTFVGR